MAKEVNEGTRRAEKILFFWCHFFYGALILVNVIPALLFGADSMTYISIVVIGLMWILVAQLLWRRMH